MFSKINEIKVRLIGYMLISETDNFKLLGFLLRRSPLSHCQDQ